MKIENITLRGEMAYRVGRNMTRMEDPFFRAEETFEDESMNGGWPADREGRAMLATTLLARLTGREAAYLEELYAKMPLNAWGYRGENIAPKADEQQLSGHNWLLRALLEMYAWKQDARSKKIADDIVKNLYLPLKGKYRVYPVDLDQRVVGGSFGGTSDGLEHEVWITSTDIGCAFMCLDGLSQYYEMFGCEAVRELLEEMIEVFAGIDLVGLKMQTHATLSATRGVIRMYRATGEEKYLQLAKRVYADYITKGMTATYANYNWFDRPEWTEPCAMVDSLLVALNLFDITDEVEYLEFAHRVFYTGLGHAQRINGGFGCDSCAGALEDGDILSIRTFEAYWCCSMRGAEGLVRMAENLVQEKDDGLLFAAYSDGIFKACDMQAEVVSRWPYEGHVEIAFSGDWQGKTIRLYAPENACVQINGACADAAWDKGFAVVKLPEEGETARLLLAFDMPLEYRKPVGFFTPGNKVSVWKGPLMLCGAPDSKKPDIARVVGKKGRVYEADGVQYEPVNQTIYIQNLQPRRVLFDE